jgi:hypothetical protein
VAKCPTELNVYKCNAQQLFLLPYGGIRRSVTCLEGSTQFPEHSLTALSAPSIRLTSLILLHLFPALKQHFGGNKFKKDIGVEKKGNDRDTEDGDLNGQEI